MNKKTSFSNQTRLPMLLLLTAISFPTMALIDQEKTTSTNSNYPSQFFEQYQPQNAYDMIERLPGFSFDGGDSARGFGGNAGNVLIDGARPTSKSGGLSGALKRIPAAQVERIEIIRGGVSGDAAGQSIVANVIKRKNVTSGTYALKFRRAPHGALKPNVEAAINTNIGQWASVFDIDIGLSPGYRHAVINEYDAEEKLINSANETRKTLGRFSFANGQMSRNFDTGKLTFNGRVGADKWKNKQGQNIYDGKQSDNKNPDSQWGFDELSRFKTAEFGADWIEKFGNWKWQSLGLGQVESRQYSSNSQTNEGDVSTGVYLYSQDSLKSEYIIRNTYGYIGRNLFKPEFGIEVARNYLDTSLEYIVDGTPEVLDNANVEIEEIRTEIFTNFVYSYSDILSIDGGLTAEFSQIEVVGDEIKKQNFNFLKPRLSATYKLNKTMSLVVKAQHIVEQLDFSDFAASSSTEDDRSVSGNSDLKPEQSSELSMRLDWSFSEKGSLKVNAYHHWRDDILEEITLASGSQGLGNAGSAKLWGLEVDMTIPTDELLKNGLLEFSYNYVNSEFNDSIIKRIRKISDYTPRDLSIKLRQDLIEHKLAWGINYYSSFENIDYLVDEVIKFEGNNRVKAFIETSFFDDYKIQLEISDLNVAKYTRTRYFYSDDRDGDYEGVEISNRRRQPYYKLSIFGAF